MFSPMQIYLNKIFCLFADLSFFEWWCFLGTCFHQLNNDFFSDPPIPLLCMCQSSMWQIQVPNSQVTMNSAINVAPIFFESCSPPCTVTLPCCTPPLWVDNADPLQEDCSPCHAFLHQVFATVWCWPFPEVVPCLLSLWHFLLQSNFWYVAFPALVFLLTLPQQLFCMTPSTMEVNCAALPLWAPVTPLMFTSPDKSNKHCLVSSYFLQEALFSHQCCCQCLFLRWEESISLWSNVQWTLQRNVMVAQRCISRKSMSETLCAETMLCHILVWYSWEIWRCNHCDFMSPCFCFYRIFLWQ